MEKIQIICDVCGSIKADSNHWWKVWIDRGSIETQQISIAPAAGGGWESDVWGEQLDVCGHVCAVKKLSEWMGQQTDSLSGDGK